MTHPLPQSFVDTFPSGLAILDREGRVIQANARSACVPGEDFFGAFGAEGFFHAARDGYLGGVAGGRVDVSFEARGCHVRLRCFDHAGDRYGIAWLDAMRGEERLLAISEAWDKALALVAEIRHNMIVKRLTGDLKLDDKQKAEVRKILTTTDALATGVKVIYEPQVKKIYDQSFQRISQTLKQEQKEKLAKRQKRLSARFNASYFTSLRTAQTAFSDMDTISRFLGLEPLQQSEVGAILKSENAQEDRIIEKYESMEQPDLAGVGRDISAVRADSITRLARILT